MTYDRQIATDFEVFVTDLYTKIADMPSYGILNDDSGSGHVAISTPNPAVIVIESNQLGSGADANRGLKVTSVAEYTNATTFTSWWDKDYSRIEFDGISSTDSVEYWLQYTDSYGFVWYLRRDVGDGNDFSAWYGLMDYGNSPGTQFWDPRSADSVSYTIDYYAVAGDTSQENDYPTKRPPATTPDRASINGGSHDGDCVGQFRGILNPDSAFDNYVWWSTLAFLQREVTDTDTGQNPVWAAIDDPLWMQDRSGSDVNTGDVIQNSEGADEWEIVDYHDVRVGLRMI